MSIADGLRDLGFKVIEAASAAGALEHLREGLVPDVLVTDHMMPGMTGATLAREARRKLPALPVLMITGYSNLRPEETRGLDVITKPFHRGDLAARITNLVARSENGNVVRLPSHPRPLTAD
ncbi:response regulator [Phenylobacterium sp.]|uniref:response regulator n=1 Tax=Phenylobacterium sp. TaxID=1871053 RepID=UPI00374D591F